MSLLSCRWSVVVCGAVVAAALAAAIAPVPAWFVERWYSRALYPALQPVVSGLSGLVPFALLDPAAALLLAAGGLGLVRGWRTRGGRTALLRGAAWLVLAAAVLYLWFLIVWGWNYRRVPLEEKLAYDQTRVSRDAAVAFARQVVGEVNGLHGNPALSDDSGELSAAFAGVVRALGTTGDAAPVRPKRSLLQLYLRRAAIDGLTNPFFLEIVLNPDLLEFERPFVLAHEWAHLAGYADESEANFIAWLACATGPRAAKYSGWLTAYQHVAAGLPADDRRNLRARLSPGVAADLEAVRRRIARSSPVLREAAREAYDAYLKANRIEEGIANYDAVVRLMLGTSFGPGWTPELRAR